jgi:PKD repeat protein
MRQLFTKILILACLVCFTSASFAQSDSNYGLLLKSGTKYLKANVDNFISSPNLSAKEVNSTYFYRLIQFEDIPNLVEQQQIANAGIKLLEYIPHKAYIAAIPSNMNFQTLKFLKVRTIMEMEATDKMDDYLRGNTYPNWATEGNEVKLNVKLQEKFSQSTILSAFLAKGAKVLHIFPHNNIIQIQVKADANAIKAVASISLVNYIEVIAAPGEREDTYGRTLHRSNSINSDIAGGLRYDGTGVTVQCRDDGPVGPHIDFQGRIEMVQAGNTGNHGDGVAGIMCGAGNLDPFMTGGATGAFMFVTDYVANFQDTTYGLHLYRGLKVTNSSYSNGCNAGYTTTTQTVDNQTYQSPTLLHVFSAGNSNNNDCGYGAGTTWGNITGGHKIGKNVIATASLNGVGTLSGFSSRGPASDGRIKPDIAAHGEGQLSTDENNTYQTFGGTSAASPSIAGISAQLIHAYKDLNNGQEPESALIKSAMLNTAQDYGNVGPDFRFGWGTVDAYRAYKLIEENRFFTGSVAQGGSNNHTITVPAGLVEARIMVYWMDPQGSLTASKALVNDLDMTVTPMGGSAALPLILNHTPNATTLNNPAVPGVDSMNNVEQVRFTNPAAGTYTVNVTGKVVPTGSRQYYVLYEFITDDIRIVYPNGGEGLDPSETARIHWDAPTATGTFNLEYSTDNGSTWQPLATKSANSYYHNWNVPASVTDQALIRITRGSVVDMSDTTFTIIGTPTGISIDTVCANGVTVSWNAVAGATSYDVLRLGTQYMDSVVNTTSLAATFPANPLDPQWVTVRARFNDGVGPRANAIQHAGGILNCVLNDELAMTLVSPSGNTSECLFDSTVAIDVTNNGALSQSNVPVYYEANGTTVSETIAGPIASGATVSYTFNTALIPTGGVNNLKVWVAVSADPIPQNDTATVSFEVFANQSLPFSDDFESYTNCFTGSDCGGTTCDLGNGWINATNGVDDNIDWRVDFGGTPSNGTGPSVDHNPGTASGNYLYLEASGGCTNQTALLMSPCIDLTTATNPYFSVWYHMDGANMGSLHVDIFSNGAWTNDIVPAITGSQGNAWQEIQTNLSSYIGQVVIIRLRGVTGGGFSSDLAIDDFNIFDFNQPPTTAFIVDQNDVCPGSVVTLTDESTFFITSRQWSFTPSTVTYVNGTSDTSSMPQVTFNSTGTYSVQLITTNANGSDTLVQTALINVNNGAALPYTDDFEAYNNCGTGSNCEVEVCALGNGWINETNNSVDNIDWRVDNNGTPSFNTGPSTDHNPGSALGNYLYLEASGGCNNQTAMLTSPCIDLTNATNPVLSLWYHMYGGDMGSLHIDVYSNGTWTTDVMTPISGDQGDQWLEAQVSLAQFIGNSVNIRIRGVTGTGFESDLAIDDIGIFDITTAPSAAMNVSSPACYNGTTFTDNSTNFPSNWDWNFGANATPQTATGAGPHNVTFSSTASQTVTLIVSSPSGADTITQTVQPDTVPMVDFSWVTANENVTFTNASNNATSYLWNFGDGALTSAANPGTHTYQSSGLFTVTLQATNDCGTSTIMKDVLVVVTDVDEITEKWDISVFPNPNKGQFTLELEGISGDVDVSITDVSGKLIRNWNYSNVGSGWNTNIDAGDLASGIYLLKVTTEDGVKNVKLMIE